MRPRRLTVNTYCELAEMPTEAHGRPSYPSLLAYEKAKLYGVRCPLLACRYFGSKLLSHRLAPGSLSITSQNVFVGNDPFAALYTWLWHKFKSFRRSDCASWSYRGVAGSIGTVHVDFLHLGLSSPLWSDVLCRCSRPSFTTRFFNACMQAQGDLDEAWARKTESASIFRTLLALKFPKIG